MRGRTRLHSVYYVGLLALFGALEEPRPEAEPGGHELSTMPGAWERRYARLDERGGLEVLLLKKTGARGLW
eukprot:590514-Lingulodinium_polyedra.AAC.1